MKIIFYQVYIILRKKLYSKVDELGTNGLTNLKRRNGVLKKIKR